jgi:hypothetical protein
MRAHNHETLAQLVATGTSLGLVPRSYDHERGEVFGEYMLPDEEGKLEVLAECMIHFTRQSQADMKNGVPAPCPHACEDKPAFKLCLVCEEEKPADFEHFYNKKGNCDSYCIPCRKAYSKSRRAA